MSTNDAEAVVTRLNLPTFICTSRGEVGHGAVQHWVR